MHSEYDSRLQDNARSLRKNMTREERHLWYDFFKTLPVTVNRQRVVGPYIVDFYCASAKLVVELDGSQHYMEQSKQNDKKRDKYLRDLGLTVKRYSNADVNYRFQAMCQDILGFILPAKK